MKSTLIGRLKLKLFKDITGRENYSPSTRQREQFASKFTKDQYTSLEISAYILTDARYILVGAEQLADDIDLHTLFAHLDSNPLSKPIFFEVTNWFNDQDIIGVWVNCCELTEEKGHFYAVAFLRDTDDEAPYFEVRTSQIEPEPAFCYFDAENKWTTASKNDPEINNNSSLQLCLKILNYLTKTQVDSFMTFEKSVEISQKHNFKAGDTGPDDPRYMHLIKQAALGKLPCHMGLTDMDNVIPLSFNACFNIPLHRLLDARKHLQIYQEQGVVVYWQDGHFIMSDDYLPYMIFRITGIKEIKVILLGDEGKNQIKVITTGGTELIPGIEIAQPFNHDFLALDLRKLYLDEYIIKLAATINLKNLLACKCVILSEDSDTRQLEVLLQANGFNTDETSIMSYDNCTKIDLLPLTLETLRKVNNNLKYIIHRDRDYLDEDKFSKIQNQIIALGAIPFITDGTDIESHFLDADHLRHINCEIDTIEALTLLREARLKTRDLSISKMLKEAYGKSYNQHLDELPHFAARYDAQPIRYSAGKETARALKSVTHQKQIKLDLFQPSPHLKHKALAGVAEKLWPY